MGEAFLFIWGVIATIFAVGPLSVAAFLDWRSKNES